MTNTPEDDSGALRSLRDRAEAASKAYHEDLAAMSLHDIAVAIHELDVHRIELDMQNEELRESRKELSESRQQFKDLYDFAPVGYLTIDENTIIVQANLKLAGMLGTDRDALIGQRFDSFVQRESQDDFYLAQRASGGSGRIWNRDVKLRTTHGATLPVSIDMMRFVDSGGARSWRCAVSDITTRLAAERAVRETVAVQASEERYRGLAEQVVDGIVVLDASGRALDANRPACEMFGYTLEEMKTLGTEHVLTAEELSSVPDTMRRLAAGGIVRDERRFKRKDGSTFAGEIVGRQLPDGRVQAVIRDITERKELESIERRLQQIATRLVDERKIEDVLGAILETAIVIAHADFGVIHLLEPESSRLRIAVHRGVPQWWVDYWETASSGKGACGAAFESGERVVVEDVEQSAIFSGTDLDVQRTAGIRAVQATPLRTRSGKRIGVFSTHWKRPCRPDERMLMLLDVVAREAAEIIRGAQAETELKRQAALLEFAHDSIFVREVDGRITYWNEGATKCYGWTKEEALGAISHVLLQTQFPEPLPRIREIVAATGYWTGELVHTCRDGRRITVDSRWASLDGADQAGGRILEIDDDITQRKQAEAALRESERRLQSYIDQAGDAIYILDGDSARILNANARAVEMLGYSLDELLQMSAGDLECAHTPADIGSIHERTKSGVVQTEGIHRRKDGSTFPIDVRVTTLAPMVPHRVLAIVRDITERKRLEHERAEQARRKDEFLAFLSHELRNPVTAIRIAVETLSRAATPAQRLDLEEIISRQTALVQRLVDDLLELERITHGHIELQRESLNLAECLQQAVATVQSTVASREQHLLLHLPGESVQFMADRARVDQIVGNLLTNASKYTRPGGTIELTGAREGSVVIIRCKDNGQGIVPELKRTIFEPYVRGPKTELGYGEASVGLGLALVKQLTELHGGTISVESAGADLGSEFTVRLPLVGPAPIPAAAVETNVARPSRRPRSIMVVEDNPNVAAALKVALEQDGHSVHLFPDGPSALAAASQIRADALLIDVGLPSMDGYELADRLKHEPTLKTAVRIALSGSRRRQDATSDAFDHYLSKPFDMEVLLALLDRK